MTDALHQMVGPTDKELHGGSFRTSLIKTESLTCLEGSPMKIVVTGALGNISKPLAQDLVQKGHSVTIISSKTERKKEIEALGAKAAIGSIADSSFVASVFKGADAAYCMLPPSNVFDPKMDAMAEATRDANSYLQAIQSSGIKHIVYLSSIGAHTDQGNGILAYHHKAESIMNQLPADVSVTFMRPVGFYYNLLGMIGGIKAQGVMASNYGADDLIPWVSPIDIATAVAEELEKSSSGRKIRYVASDELTCNEVAHILGAAIGIPDLKWIVISNDQLLSGMKAFGMNDSFAKGLVEMNAAIHTKELFQDYYGNRPVLGRTKIKDYAKEFALAFNRS